MIRSLGSAGLTIVTLGTGLGLYFVSYSVSAERNKIERLERQIASDNHDIRGLEAELRVRANLPQLERWNTEVLALSAPKAGQILESEVELASLVNPDPGTAAKADVRLAAVELPKVEKAEPRVEIALAESTAPVTASPEGGLFSAAFVAEIDTAAARERAGIAKVALR